MSYFLPFKENQKILELGGGNCPQFRPNLDIRKEPNVDIVADLNESLPIKNEEWDGIYSSYQLEHLSWRKIKSFIKEVYRILKPGGCAVFITADLLEQARIITEVPELNDKWVGMIFGDNDYPENAHRAGFSPEYAGRLFKEAGFERVSVIRHPNWRGDMIIEVEKAKMSRKELFNKNYFHGGEKVGGYANEGYRDFYQHWITYSKILKENPKSILELGCARGFILKKFQDIGVPVQGIEISNHCQLTKSVKEILEWDVCNTPWPFQDKQFDFCFSIAVLEHIPEEHLPAIVQEIQRVSSRGMHGVDFGDNDDGFDKTHCTLRPHSWWENIFPTNQKILNKEDLEKIPDNFLLHDILPPEDDLLKLNLGCYTNMFYYGWINIDVLPLEDFAKNNGYKFVQKDIREGLPFKDQSVDLIYSSHFIEHLTYEEAFNFIKECKRILKPQGVCRLLFPDTEKLVKNYLDKKMESLDELSDASKYAQIDRLWNFIFSGHKSAFDFELIQKIGQNLNFHVEKKEFRDGNKQILKETIDSLPEVSLFVELTA
jgi:predicted SAM-dependent methyltransferase